MSKIFEYEDYRGFLGDLILSHPSKGRGLKLKLAHFLNCHPAYVSLVMKGSADFSVEQAQGVADFFGLSEEETHFFLLLVQLKRAGTSKLKNYYLKQIGEIVERRSILKNRLEFKRELAAIDQMTYYSAWYFAAIHMALNISALRSKVALAEYFNLPLKTVSEVVQFLTSVGLAREVAGKLEPGTASIHLGESPMMRHTHRMWRTQALVSLDQQRAEDFHYSSVISLSEKDVKKVKALMIRTVEEARALIKDSRDEVVYSYNLDLFSLRR